jgi:macrolide transport system ATP-binding/permease protein
MWRRKREQDLDRELRTHLELEAEERGDAYAARRALGNAGLIKEDVRRMWGWTWLERLWQDLRYAARVLRKSPGFASIAVLSLALGIGANTALFSVVDAVMLKNLPVQNPQQLRILTWVHDPKDNSKEPIHSHEDGGTFSYPAYQLFRDHVPQFSDLIGYAGDRITVTARRSSEIAIGWFVTGNYFTGLGVLPIAGRTIEPDDDTRGKPAVAVLSYRYWEQRFGLDPGVLGSEISINRVPVTVIGILPPAFQGLDPGAETDVFLPMSQAPDMAPRWNSLTDQYSWWIQVFGRPRPGVSDAAAAQAVQAILASDIQSYAGPGFYIPEVRLEPGGRGIGDLRDYAATRLYVLEAITGMVLLIACVNLANLLLARSAARGKETAVRLSLGASRPRLIRQLLTESLLLAGAGGVVGLLVARALVEVLNLAVFASAGYLIPDVRLDHRALVFTLGTATLTAVLSGLLPAWRAMRVDLGPSLKGAGSGRALSGASRRYASRILIVAQVALSALLLIGAGLFVRTLVGLTAVDLGFKTSHLLVFQTDASHGGYQGAMLADAYERIRERIESIPGVVSVGLSQNTLIQGWETSDDIPMRSNSPPPGGYLHTHMLDCSDSFLSTMQIPLLLGRDLAASDGPGSTPVAVVNEVFVRGYFLPGVNPLGQNFGAAPGVEIVGVVKDAHYDRVRGDAPPTAYFPYRQNTKNLGRMTYAIRTGPAPLSVAQSVRRAVSEVDPAIPVDRLRTMEEQIGLTLGSEHILAELVSAFGLAAAFLAAIGLYGVMAYTVARRTSEFGIRMALGADGRSVAWLVVRESVGMIAAGLAGGLPAALALGRLARSFLSSTLYGVSPNDPWSFAAAALLLAAAGAAAAYFPARRASRVDPMTALRND